MAILAFDTCFNACSAALRWLDHVTLEPRIWHYRSATRFERMSTGHAERLVPMIAEVVAESPIGFEQITSIVVTAGPGTFTGTRIGVSVARALSLSLGVPAFGVSSLHAMSRSVATRVFTEFREAVTGEREGVVTPAMHAEFATHDFAVAVDARRGQVYFQLFGDAHHGPLMPPQLITPEAAASLLRERPTHIAGSGAATVCVEAGRLGRTLHSRFEDLAPDAADLLGLGVEHAVSPPSPLYLRPPDAKPPQNAAVARAEPRS